MKKKIMIISSIIIILIAISGVILFKHYGDRIVSNNSGGNSSEIKHNENKEFLKDVETETFFITNIKCSYNGEVSLISYDIKNKTNETVHLGEYEITVKNEKKEVITTINPSLDQDLAAGESTPISNEVNIDLTDAYMMDFSFDLG